MRPGETKEREKPMTNEEMWNNEQPVGSLIDIEVPEWIDSDISARDVAAICQGGCACGAYMPAVTYHTARETMNEHGDDVLQFLEDYSDGIPEVPRGESWAGIAVFFLSYAVELWASMAESELESWEVA